MKMSSRRVDLSSFRRYMLILSVQSRLLTVTLLFVMPHLHQSNTFSINTGARVLSVIHFLLCNSLTLKTDADLVCTHAKMRFNPSHSLVDTETGSTLSDADVLETFKPLWVPLHNNMLRRMFYIVSSTASRWQSHTHTSMNSSSLFYLYSYNPHVF